MNGVIYSKLVLTPDGVRLETYTERPDYPENGDQERIKQLRYVSIFNQDA